MIRLVRESCNYVARLTAAAAAATTVNTSEESTNYCFIGIKFELFVVKLMSGKATKPSTLPSIIIIIIIQYIQ